MSGGAMDILFWISIRSELSQILAPVKFKKWKTVIFPQPGGVKALIHHIIISKKWKNNALTCESSTIFAWQSITTK